MTHIALVFVDHAKHVVDNDRPAAELVIVIFGNKCVIGIARIVLSEY
jgi:hypothetical protein